MNSTIFLSLDLGTTLEDWLDHYCWLIDNCVLDQLGHCRAISDAWKIWWSVIMSPVLATNWTTRCVDTAEGQRAMARAFLSAYTSARSWLLKVDHAASECDASGSFAQSTHVPSLEYSRSVMT